MSEILNFWPQPITLSLAQICELVNGTLSEGLHPNTMIAGIAPLDLARSGDVTFLENVKYLSQLNGNSASACLISPKHAMRAPAGLPLIIVDKPYNAMATIGAKLFPLAMRISGTYQQSAHGMAGIVHPTAHIEPEVMIEPGAIIGEHAEIGTGTIINAGAIIGHHVKIGRNCCIGAGASITNALLGNDVMIHAGARIGQDGFGFAMGASHQKVPQLGRVIIQDHVEIGANTCIDRGTVRDTVIGEGTKIDNQVQIGHNVQIGRHCVIVSQVGISGSTILEDYVVLGGKVGTNGHITIGQGAQVAGSSNVKDNIPAGEIWGGTPAQPLKQWAREISALKTLARKGKIGEKTNSHTDEAPQ